eukprot:1750352-Rhodomonas_salina.2
MIPTFPSLAATVMQCGQVASSFDKRQHRHGRREAKKDSSADQCQVQGREGRKQGSAEPVTVLITTFWRREDCRTRWRVERRDGVAEDSKEMLSLVTSQLQSSFVRRGEGQYKKKDVGEIQGGRGAREGGGKGAGAGAGAVS